VETGTFTGPGGYLDALDGLLATARREIRILDDDLAGQGWEGRNRPGLLEAFLVGDRLRRARILLRSPDHVLARCPLLLGLLRQHGHQLEIRVAEPGAEWREAYALGDDGLLVLRHHYQGWQGRADPADPRTVARLGEGFDAEWSRVTGGLSPTALGL